MRRPLLEEMVLSSSVTYSVLERDRHTTVQTVTTPVCLNRLALLQCFLPRSSADISSTTMSTQIPDKMKPPTELSSISDEHSTDIPVPCKIQASDLNADSKGLDNRALTVGVAVGVGEAVIGIVIVAIILVVQRYRHSQNGTHRESGATDEYCYENEDFVVENRRRNRPCPEVASETERPQSVYSVDDTYDQISFS
ncbi:uncharacterized protein LOC135462920 isoform X2 [Liolophura sinensis]|uniref:uncharacterized protein LOC135462920 isoform X2 n=1 Tax=Liolophura sinensis TaxID=3198878 RepID=UPI00315941CB